MTMPEMCPHHASVYRTRAAAIRNLPHGHKAPHTGGPPRRRAVPRMSGVATVSPEPLPDRYRCRVCGLSYVVPSLARCCEIEHHRLRDAQIEETA